MIITYFLLAYFIMCDIVCNSNNDNRILVLYTSICLFNYKIFITYFLLAYFIMCVYIVCNSNNDKRILVYNTYVVIKLLV